ncbi:MAG: AAA family ATPase [Acidobacteria bacterium]|nr:AAA family ATPase [Acidobacteriota bacterium]
MTTVNAPALPKLKLPKIDFVRLRRFSLFAANPDAEFAAGDGVLCLVGANGIGKSTLLSAINFCLTGTVPDPRRAFESIDEYYKFTRQYSRTYFRGRIRGSDEDDAEITLVFTLGEFKYTVTRGLFEPDELRFLLITDLEGRMHTDPPPGDDVPRLHRHRVYADSLVAHAGLTSFEEFVFLQHFVFTFDEQRRTLFWDPRIMERVLYRAFGLDPAMAKKADSIRREIQHQDSRVRNYQWESTRMGRRIRAIRARADKLTGAEEDYSRLVDDHKRLSTLFDEQTNDLRAAQDALKDAHLRLAELSVRETALRDEYSRFFDAQFATRPPLTQHPLILRSLETQVCGLCGAAGSEPATTIADRAKATTCPLCASPTRAAPEATAGTEDLQDIDRQLSDIKTHLRDVHKSIESLTETQRQAQLAWDSTSRELNEFQHQNNVTMEELRTLLNEEVKEKSLADYSDQLRVIEEDKKVAYDRRETLKRQLLELQRDLEEQYLQVEATFVPMFSDLAQQFLGMPLSVQMDAGQRDSVKLVVEVRGTTRREQQQLSESQRFFLDIALRMALTRHMSDPYSLGGMFIDTPEGSLDIAYEKRAGDMLSDFVRLGHQIVMTANLNSSKLLLELAHDCGRPLMTLCRMTEWADLSDVQKEEDELFVEAYRQIDTALGD